MFQVHRTVIGDSPAIELSNSQVSVTVMPSLGAKIISLINRRSGREWMWRSPHTSRFELVPPGSSFDLGAFSGADECIPTIAPCYWRGHDLPDHGEAWNVAWELNESLVEHGQIVTSVYLSISPLFIERKLFIEGSCIHFEYSVKNISSDTYEYIWAFHPLFDIQAGDQIILPDSVTQVATDASLGFQDSGGSELGTLWTWPQPNQDINFSKLELGGNGRAIKLYSHGLTEGSAELINSRTGDRLSIAFDPNDTNTLGIWINRGGFGGFHHIALEPTNGAPDSLKTAVEKWHRFGRLDAHQVRKWSFSINLSQIDES